MDNMIPKYLFRGDSDKAGIRLLKDTIDHFQLQKNLINGREITEEPLLDLINKHVEIGWTKKHFLSFSECEKTAYRFGLDCEIGEVDNKMYKCSEYYESDKNWNFAIIKIDTNKIEWKRIDKGVCEGWYEPSLIKFKYTDKYRIIGINVIDTLVGQEKYELSKVNANRDREWLILPATPIQLNNVIEFSAILDGTCISEIIKYKQ